MAGLGDVFATDYEAVKGGKTKISKAILSKDMNWPNPRDILDLATNIPVVGDALSGGMAMYDAAKGDYGSAAMNALGVLPFVSAGMTKGVGKAASAVNTRPLTEFEQRHLTAQKNAALPVEQGGLGLPVDNTAMQRADAMGFNQNLYHGRYSDYDNIKDGRTFYATPDPSYASIYAMEPTASSMSGKSISAF